jgi:hypothetical protein
MMMKSIRLMPVYILLMFTQPLGATPSAASGSVEQLLGVAADSYAVLITEYRHPGSYYEGYRTEWRELRSMADGSVVEREKLVEIKWTRGHVPDEADYGKLTETVLFEAPPEVRARGDWDPVREGPSPRLRLEGGKLYAVGHEPPVADIGILSTDVVQFLGAAQGYWFLAIGEGEVMLDVIIPRVVRAIPAPEGW